MDTKNAGWDIPGLPAGSGAGTGTEPGTGQGLGWDRDTDGDKGQGWGQGTGHGWGQGWGQGQGQRQKLCSVPWQGHPGAQGWDKELIPLSHQLSSEQLQNQKSLEMLIILTLIIPMLIILPSPAGRWDQLPWGRTCPRASDDPLMIRQLIKW